MDIKKENCIEAFRELGLQNPETYFGDYGQNGVFEAVESGEIDSDGFHRALRPLLPEGTSDAAIDTAFNKFLTGIPVHRLRQLQQLRRDGYRVYLLSNTNPVMWNDVIKSEFEKDGLSREDYFDGIVTSFEAKALKPHPEIFEYACRTLGIDAAETLFLDDSQANLDGAARLGFQTALVRSGDEFAQLVQQHISL